MVSEVVLSSAMGGRSDGGCWLSRIARAGSSSQRYSIRATDNKHLIDATAAGQKVISFAVAPIGLALRNKVKHDETSTLLGCGPGFVQSRAAARVQWFCQYLSMLPDEQPKSADFTDALFGPKTSQKYTFRRKPISKIRPTRVYSQPDSMSVFQVFQVFRHAIRNANPRPARLHSQRRE
jgi:hypothetical protein